MVDFTTFSMPPQADWLHVSLHLSRFISRWHCLATGVRTTLSPPSLVTVIARLCVMSQDCFQTYSTTLSMSRSLELFRINNTNLVTFCIGPYLNLISLSNIYFIQGSGFSSWLGVYMTWCCRVMELVLGPECLSTGREVVSTCGGM